MLLRPNCWKIALAASVLALGALASADDGSVSGESGAVELVKGKNSSVRMVSEEVRIGALPKGRVHARFVFRNEGGPTSVLMGFPASASGVDTRARDAKLEGFRSWVDGKPVKVRWTLGRSGDEGYDAWYVKRVRFGRGQVHVVEDAYGGGGGGMSDGFRSYSYVLQTGASWKGSIGRAKIALDLGLLAEYSPIQISGPAHSRKGALVLWDLHNFKPGLHDNIQINWYPGFRNVYVNGSPVGADLDGVRSNPRMTFWTMGFGHDRWLTQLCIHRAHTIEAPLPLAAEWLGAKLNHVGRARYRLTLGTRWIELRTGSKRVLCSSGKLLDMAQPLRYATVANGDTIADGAYVGDLRQMVRGLGGKSKYDPSNDRLDVQLHP
jgi:hypothetical protein